jgi:predicted ATPase
VIHRVRLRRFKRFGDVEFILPGHVVLAGPNNTGKTTVLQAIAAWSLALGRWKQLNDFQRHGGHYTKAPIARQAFSAVPLRAFDLLWQERDYHAARPVEIEVQSATGWTVAMELSADTTEQIFVRPLAGATPDVVRSAHLTTVFVPAMSGLGIEEPVYTRPKIDQLLGQAKPGDVLRNLLVEAAGSARAWEALDASIRRLFGFELAPPDAAGPHILAEYREKAGGPALDIASAGSGFQQVLMLLAFLLTRPGAVLLLDEPDAHLHVILQDAIYSELRTVAAQRRSQLVIATHSEVIIDAVEPRELCVVFDRPRLLATTEQRARLIESLRILSHTDIMQAQAAPGVLYLEDYTDLEILRAWTRVLDHPARELLTTRLFWKRTVVEPRPGAPGVRARDHYEALQLVREDLPALELVDGDARPEIQSTEISGRGFQRLRWRRYEIESYLVHPEALARFVEHTVGAAAAAPHVADLRRYLTDNLPPAVLRAPLDDHDYLNTTKARTAVLPPALTAAGLPGLPYTRYHEIAALMRPEEIHLEVREKLDAIVRAFGQ